MAVPAARVPDGRANRPAGPRTDALRVLVVDDSRAMRMIVTRELRNIDAISEVLEADSAEAAVDLLPTEPIDLILCDWNMGGMTGLEFLQALRAAEWEVPFGFVTSESSAAVQQSAFDAGAAFLVAKPFTSADLVSKIEGFLAGAAPSASVATATLPEDRATAIAELLSGLVRKEVTVAAAKTGTSRSMARWSADYLNEAGEVAALCVVETPIAAALAAALTLMSPQTAAEWASSGTLPDVLSEAFHEITNVLAKVARVDRERCVLGTIRGYASGDKLLEHDAVEAASAPEHFSVALVGYGSGVLSLVTL